MPQSGFEEGFTVSTSGSLDTWVKEIFAKVPGTVEGYIYDQLKLVAKDFFQRSKTWRATSGPFDILAGDGTHCLNPYDGYSKVIQVLHVYRNGTSFSPIPLTKVRRSWNSTNSTPRTYYVDPYDTIVLDPTPSEIVDDMYADVVLTPRIHSDNRIAEWIEDQCYEALLAGTLHRLYQEPGKVYTNNNAAEFWGKKYRAEITRARSAGIHNYKQGTTTWSYNRWNM